MVTAHIRVKVCILPVGLVRASRTFFLKYDNQVISGRGMYLSHNLYLRGFRNKACTGPAPCGNIVRIKNLAGPKRQTPASDTAIQRVTQTHELINFFI